MTNSPTPSLKRFSLKYQPKYFCLRCQILYLKHPLEPSPGWIGQHYCCSSLISCSFMGIYSLGCVCLSYRRLAFTDSLTYGRDWFDLEKNLRVRRTRCTTMYFKGSIKVLFEAQLMKTAVVRWLINMPLHESTEVPKRISVKRRFLSACVSKKNSWHQKSHHVPTRYFIVSLQPNFLVALWRYLTKQEIRNDVSLFSLLHPVRNLTLDYL